MTVACIGLAAYLLTRHFGSFLYFVSVFAAIGFGGRAFHTWLRIRA